MYDGDSSSNEDTYTYSVDGSTVTIYDDSGEKRGELIYVSDQLVQVGMTFTLEGSSGAGSAISLAGTTWTTSLDNGTIVYKFESDGTVTGYVDGDPTNTSTANYTVSGSMVTISVDGVAVRELIYVSGKLIYGAIYTKVS